MVVAIRSEDSDAPRFRAFVDGTWQHFQMSDDERKEEFLRRSLGGDLAGVRELLHRHPELGTHSGTSIHPLIAEFVAQKSGHCYRADDLKIADLFISKEVRDFRDAVVEDRVEAARELLHARPDLVAAEFTAGRGIGRAIHHWKSIEMAKTLLDCGANLNELNSLQESPLSLQLRFGTIAAVAFLLEQGADPNIGEGAHLPSADMRTRIELLLEHGWDINRGQLLHDANHGFGSRVQTWLSYGANPNVTTADGKTALHLLGSRGTGRAAIRALAGAGADLQARDNAGKTAIDYARAANQNVAAQEIESLIRQQSEP